MTESRPSRTPALLVLAAVFTAVTASYGLARIAWTRWEPAAWLGLTFDEATLELSSVASQGPAGRAGLKPFDRIVDVDDHPAANYLIVYDQLRRVRVGDPVRFTVKLAGLGDLTTREVLAERWPDRERPAFSTFLSRGLTQACPLLLFLVTALALLSRPDHRHAWSLALIFAGVLATAPLDPIVEGIPPWLRGPAYSYKVLLETLAPAVLVYLFAVFPVPSPLDDRFPQAKTWWLAGAGGLALPASLWVLFSPEVARGGLARVAFALAVLSWVAAVLFSVVSGAWNMREAAADDVRRRLRLAAQGALVAALPALLLWSAGGVSPWISVPALGATLLLPLAWTQTILAPELVDSRVLAKRGARLLLLGRGHVALAVVLAGLIGSSLADGIAGLMGPSGPRWALPAGIAAGLAVATLCIWGARRLHARFRDRIDRFLFRSDYESRQALSDLAARLRAAPSAEELTRDLERQIHLALVPTSLAIYLKRGEDRLRIERGIVPEEFEEIALDTPMLPRAVGPQRTRAIRALDRVIEIGSDCLVPMTGQGTGLVGLIVLGSRGTREPYSVEHKRLLGSIGCEAAQALQALAARRESVEA